MQNRAKNSLFFENNSAFKNEERFFIMLIQPAKLLGTMICFFQILTMLIYSYYFKPATDQKRPFQIRQ
ncbi:hypothetical protein FGO68_gene13029 [Halteria grandinella]|uniref:Uncharacterized protein n=1 Tax=Halteria grandinella TaxID=5974 RepID=A0A8J8P8Y9_HALGN|nr:hypothetical protein FGO68_gene13029 [Halteria grandinella]